MKYKLNSLWDFAMILMYFKYWDQPFVSVLILHKQTFIQNADKDVGHHPCRRNLRLFVFLVHTVLTNIGPIRTQNVSFGLITFRVALVYSKSPSLRDGH